MAEVDQVPESVRQACSGPDAAARCGVLGYFTGGPGFIERLVLDSYQARGILTFLVNALGHHVLKAGIDANIGYYEHIKAYSGRDAYTEQPESTVPGPTAGTQPFAVFDARNFGYLAAPDQPVFLDLNNAKSKSVILGGFVQDSWSILDKVTLNLGLRYDTLTLAGADGVVRIALKDQWSPRIGVIWDPTQAGRSKSMPTTGGTTSRSPSTSPTASSRSPRACWAGTTSTAIRSRTASTTATPTPAGPAQPAPASTGV